MLFWDIPPNQTILSRYTLSSVSISERGVGQERKSERQTEKKEEELDQTGVREGKS